MPNMPKMSVQAIRARSPQQHSLELLKPECVRIVHSCHKNNPCVTRCNGQPLSHQSLPPIWRPPILCYVWEKYAGRQINELCKFNLTRPLGNWELLCIQNWREFKKKKRFSGSLSWQVSKCLNFCRLRRWISNQLSIVCCFLWYFQELCAIYFWFVVTVLLIFIKLQKLSLTESFLNAIPAANDGSQLSLKESLHN